MRISTSLLFFTLYLFYNIQLYKCNNFQYLTGHIYHCQYFVTIIGHHCVQQLCFIPLQNILIKLELLDHNVIILRHLTYIDKLSCKNLYHCILCFHDRLKIPDSYTLLDKDLSVRASLKDNEKQEQGALLSPYRVCQPISEPFFRPGS